jgi:hypothetical protein
VIALAKKGNCGCGCILSGKGRKAEKKPTPPKKQAK